MQKRERLSNLKKPVYIQETVVLEENQKCDN